MNCMLPTASQVVIGGCCRCLDLGLQDEGIRGIFLSEGLLAIALPLLAVKDSNSPIDALTTAIADLPDGSILDVDPVRYANTVLKFLRDLAFSSCDYAALCTSLCKTWRCTSSSRLSS